MTLCNTTQCVWRKNWFNFFCVLLTVMVALLAQVMDIKGVFGRVI